MGRSAIHVLLLAATVMAPARAEPPAARPDHWSFRPLQRPGVPAIRPDAPGQSAIRNPIDRFIRAKLEAAGLRPSSEADRRTLIRRLSFDLLGLPPEPARVEAFVNDARPDAYERLVDEFLASPAYGERWARHWLDVVHYGETHGYDKDKPRPNAWPYRDYVIRALNSDKPYARFVQEQLAGDLLFPGTRDGIEALGFIAAGPWDFIGHAELPETKIDGQIARHLDRDDMVGNALGTFMSLTVQCAACHDHKFDPITQVDYYRLQAVFAAVDRTDFAYDLDLMLTRRRAELTMRQRGLKSRLAELDAQLVKSGGRRVELLNRLIDEAKRGREVPERVEFGYHSQIEAKQDVVKWVQVDLGAPRDIDALVYVGCHDTFNNIGAGFGFPVRYKVEVSDDPKFAGGVTVVEDRTKADVVKPGVMPQRVKVGRAARYIRVTATKLAPRQNDYIFALAELQALDKAGRNLALGAAVTALDSIEAPPRWGRTNLTDGYYFGGIAKRSASEIACLERERDDALVGVTDQTVRMKREAVARDLAAVDGELTKLPPAHVVYAGVVHNGSGAFRGTGPDGGRPRTIHVLKRGDVTKPGPMVGAGAIASVARVFGAPETFDLQPGHREGERRAALAKWITHPDNPLTWRSIVNRVWQYHFGRGLVDTPNDFGKMGQAPSHPELLDWLAVEFRDGGGSLKNLHRLIVASATYRQQSGIGDSRNNSQFAIRNSQSSDPDNRLLGRMNRRKLEAEAVRDAALAVAGRLDRRMGGPSFQDFVIEQPDHSPHYEYGKHDPDDPRTHRRSVYRFIVRSQPQPFMSTLDCADPSMRVDKRNESLSPLQALALLNEGFMLTMSRHCAAHVQTRSTELSGQVAAAYRSALGRLPSQAERDKLITFVRAYGLTNACRVLFNLNEFTFID